MTEISIKINATHEQIAEIKKLSNRRMRGKLYSPRGKYLIENFGKVISEAIRESLPPDGFDDVLDSRYSENDDSLSLLTTSIEKAKIFSEETLRIFPLSHSELSQDEVNRLRTIVKSCSYIGFRRGYLQGHADATPPDPELKA